MSNIVFVKKGSKLRTSNQSIIIEVEKENKEVPVSEISVVIIESLECSITAATNVMCSKNNIPIIYCDQKHSPIAISNSFNTYYKQLPRIQEQIKWSTSRKQKLMMMIVKYKIINQLELLRYLKKDLDVIVEIENKLKKINSDNFINT